MSPITRSYRLGSLGDDSATLADVGFSPAQITTILQAHASGALSDTGYNQLVSGNVDPAALTDFLGADVGAPQSGLSLTTLGLAALVVLVLLMPRR